MQARARLLAERIYLERPREFSRRLGRLLAGVAGGAIRWARVEVWRVWLRTARMRLEE